MLGNENFVSLSPHNRTLVAQRNMKLWTEICEFENVDLHDSFVIGWKCSDDTFFIDLEVSLWPGHKDYEAPKTGEYTCYKKARLIFRNPNNVEGLTPMSKVQPNNVIEGEIPDYDTVENFELGNGEFHLEGSFGDVTLLADDWAFKVSAKLPSRGN